MTKSPPQIDSDAFKRTDGRPIDGHKSWWKFYDFSMAEVFDNGSDLKTSIITKTAVTDKEFTVGKIIYKKDTGWGIPIKLVTSVQRDKQKRITHYYISGFGWVDRERAIAMTCYHEIDNARPVFPAGRNSYIRTRRDKQLFNNLELKG